MSKIRSSRQKGALVWVTWRNEERHVLDTEKSEVVDPVRESERGGEVDADGHSLREGNAFLVELSLEEDGVKGHRYSENCVNGGYNSVFRGWGSGKRGVRRAERGGLIMGGKARERGWQKGPFARPVEGIVDTSSLRYDALL